MKKYSNSLISVIIPTYNRAHIIGETLDSIIAQTYKNWECIIVDDYSTDNTEEIIKQYIKEDNRFSFYLKPKGLPKGPSASRNLGLKLAQGTLVNFFDSDDLMVQNKLETDVSKLLSGGYDFTISQSEFFYPTGEKNKRYWNTHLFSDDAFNDFIIKKIGWSVNTPLWKKSKLIERNLYFDEFLMTGDDYFFHLEALEKKFKPIIYNAVMVKVRGEGKRLQNFKNKTPFKLKIFYRLLTEHRFKINDDVKLKLQEEIIRLIKTAYKHKDINTAFLYSLKMMRNSSGFKYYPELIKICFFGVFYKITAKGYSFLE